MQELLEAPHLEEAAHGLPEEGQAVLASLEDPEWLLVGLDQHIMI